MLGATHDMTLVFKPGTTHRGPAHVSLGGKREQETHGDFAHQTHVQGFKSRQTWPRCDMLWDLFVGLLLIFKAWQGMIPYVHSQHVPSS